MKLKRKKFGIFHIYIYMFGIKNDKNYTSYIRYFKHLTHDFCFTSDNIAHKFIIVNQTELQIVCYSFIKM